MNFEKRQGKKNYTLVTILWRIYRVARMIFRITDIVYPWSEAHPEVATTEVLEQSVWRLEQDRASQLPTEVKRRSDHSILGVVKMDNQHRDS